MVAIGTVVRAVAAGRSQIRNYSVERDAEPPEAREFWFRDTDDVCVYSSRVVQLERVDSEEVESAPLEGVPLPDQPLGSYVPPSRRGGTRKARSPNTQGALEDTRAINLSLTSRERADATVRRWLPRLTDASPDVRKEAARHVGEVAMLEPRYRKKLVPKLLALCEPRQPWPVVDGVLAAIGDLPREDPDWTDSFLGVYVTLARSAEYVLGETGYRGIWYLIKDDVLTDRHSRTGEVVAMARADLESRTGDERLYIYHILDWYEDLTNSG